MNAPRPTPLYRLIHVDNLALILHRGGMHASNFIPDDGRVYRVIHHQSIQTRRADRDVPCGPGGVCHDYVPFYFGPRSPMLLSLRNGHVEGYHEGQEPLIYLVAYAQDIEADKLGFVFTDGHAIIRFTDFFDHLSMLDAIDWQAVYARYWFDTDEEPDRKRRKQAEFLAYQFCPWSCVRQIGVLTTAMQQRVASILESANPSHHPEIRIQRAWYY